MISGRIAAGTSTRTPRRARLQRPRYCHGSGARMLWSWPSMTSPSIALLMIHGALRGRFKPAMNVCVPMRRPVHSFPNACRTDCARICGGECFLTDASSKNTRNTSRSGCAGMAGRWCRTHVLRRSFTCAPSRLVAMLCPASTSNGTNTPTLLFTSLLGAVDIQDSHWV